tara:strand:- start:1434 stop:1622 length:189 start_codon:yes stop_codon:yes gene_type:complete
MTIGNNYMFIATGEFNERKRAAKFVTIKFIFISVTVEVSSTYTMFSLSMFKKARINLTFTIE